LTWNNGQGSLLSNKDVSIHQVVHDQGQHVRLESIKIEIKGTVIWGKTGRGKKFKVILKIFRQCFLEFFFHKKEHN
jgi:hypothetical protein